MIEGFVCTVPVYEYKGWSFEYKIYCGPWPLKKNGELKKLAGRKFWKMFFEFSKLPEEEQEKYRVGGGCMRFGG